MIRDMEYYTVEATKTAATLIEHQSFGFRSKLQAIGFDLAELRGHDWRGVDLANEDLRGLDFSGCDFRGASFSGARIAGACFSGCKFDDTGGLSEAQDFVLWDPEETRRPIVHRAIDYGYFEEKLVHESHVLGLLNIADNRILTWGGDDCVRLWSANFEPIGDPERIDFKISEVVQVDHDRLVVCGISAELIFLDLELNEIRRPALHDDLIKGAIPLSGGGFASWCKNDYVIIWSREGKPVHQERPRKGKIRGVLNAQDGSLIIWGTDKLIYVIPSGGGQTRTLKITAAISDVFEVGETIIVFSKSGKFLKAFSLAELKEKAHMALPSKLADITLVPISSGRLFLFHEGGKQIKVLDEALEPKVFVSTDRSLNLEKVNPDGSFYAWDMDMNLAVWDPLNRIVTRILTGSESTAYSFISDDDVIISLSREGALKVHGSSGVLINERMLLGVGGDVRGIKLADGRIAFWGRGPAVGLIG